MTNKIAIVYGSTTGSIENSAEIIAEALAPYPVQLFDISVDEINIDDFDVVLFGISTWEYGGMQEDWIEHFPAFIELDVSGKMCALFGQGDQDGYDEWFQDALGDVHEVLVEKEAYIVGYWPNEGYDFKASRGLTEDGKQFLGLSLDDDNQPELTEERINTWVEQLKVSIKEFELACESA